MLLTALSAGALAGSRSGKPVTIEAADESIPSSYIEITLNLMARFVQGWKAMANLLCIMAARLAAGARARRWWKGDKPGQPLRRWRDWRRPQGNGRGRRDSIQAMSRCLRRA